MHVESDVANQYCIKVSACCHKLSFSIITGKDRQKILSRSDLTEVQVPFAENWLLNKLLLHKQTEPLLSQRTSL